MTKPLRLNAQAANYLSKASSRAGSKDFIKPLNSASTLQTSVMASRRLALNLSQGLRNRAALSAAAPLRRGFATPTTVGKTQTSTLPNGLTVSAINRDQLVSTCISDRLSNFCVPDRDRALALRANVDCRCVD